MRRAMYVLLPAVLAGCGGGNDGGQGAASAPPPMTMATPAAMPSPSMVPADQMTIRAELVKVDTAARTLTVRDVAPTGGGAVAAASKTLTVDDPAMLASFKAGDQVAITCRTSMSVPVGGTTATGTATSPAPAGSTMASPGVAGTAGTAPAGTGTTATDATALASVNACQGVISVAAADASAAAAGATATPAGGTASPTPAR